MPVNKTERRSEFDDLYEINSQAWHDFNVQACLNTDYYLKAQNTQEEVDRADQQNRTLYVFDKIARQVNLLHGYEIRNRHILKIGPVGNFETEEDEACNQHTGVVMSDMQRNNGYDTMSEAFKWGVLVQGHNLVEQWRDRNGQLQFGRLGYSQFLIDHGTTKDDLSDCQDILTGQWISTDKAKMLVPTKASRIDEITPLTSSSRWEFQAQPAMQNKAGKRLYEQWWHRESIEVDIIQNRNTGEKMTLKEFKAEVMQQFGRDDKEFIDQVMEQFRNQDGSPVFVKFREFQDKIRLTIFLDDQFLWEGENPLGIKDFNYTWVHANWCPEATQSGLKLQSFVFGLRDPQRALNRRVNQIIDIIESSVHGIRMTKAKYLMNPEETFKSGQGLSLFVKDETPDNLPFDQIFRQTPGNEVQQSLFAAIEMVDKAETEAGGLNQEIFGADDKDIPGVLHQYRTGQALTGQAWMFQNFRASKRDLGRKHVQLVQLNYDPTRVQKILNEQPVKGFYDDDLTRFDCSPTEGLLTDSQQNLYYQELIELRTRFDDFKGIITPQMLVEASPIQYKTKTLKAIEQAQQAAQKAGQEQQQLQQQNQQLANSIAALNVSQSQENIADAQEKRSQIPLNNAKTITEINKNQAAADAAQMKPFLDMVKEAVRLEIATQNQANRQQLQNTRP